jgi:hypothetical protein
MVSLPIWFRAESELTNMALESRHQVPDPSEHGDYIITRGENRTFPHHRAKRTAGLRPIVINGRTCLNFYVLHSCSEKRALITRADYLKALKQAGRSESAEDYCHHLGNFSLNGSAYFALEEEGEQRVGVGMVAAGIPAQLARNAQAYKGPSGTPAAIRQLAALTLKNTELSIRDFIDQIRY